MDLLTEPDEPDDHTVAALARSTFEDYRTTLSQIRGEEVLTGDLPTDPTYLSWTMAATCLLTMRDRQNLLEAETASLRLSMLTAMMAQEIRAMNAVPSLPATEVSRTSWSPN